jgi:hypothetical protein
MSCNITKTNFIEQANKKYNNKYDYSKSVYIKANKLMTIICNIHGEFQQTPYNHIKMNGCKHCIAQELFINKINERWSNILDLSNIVFKNLQSKLDVICKNCNSNYIIRGISLLHGNYYGCKKCYKDNNYNKTIFIEKATNVHTAIFNYDLVEYIDSHTKVKILCPNNHIFSQTPNTHLSGRGCPKCIGKNKTQDEFIQLSKNRYGDIFDYSNVIYVDMLTHVILKCSNNHIFTVTPDYHINSKESKGGCKECQWNNTSERLTYIRPQWIELARQRHNNYYDYSKVEYTTSLTKVIIICPTHGEFTQTPVSHLSGSGCRSCKTVTRYSKSQIECLKLFEISLGFIQHAKNIGEFKIPDTPYYADGYNSENNTIIEFHGDFWHGNPDIFKREQINPITLFTFGELYDRTINRTNHIKTLGYNVIEIWENKWKKGIRAIKKIQKNYRKNKRN